MSTTPPLPDSVTAFLHDEAVVAPVSPSETGHFPVMRFSHLRTPPPEDSMSEVQFLRSKLPLEWGHQTHSSCISSPVAAVAHSLLFLGLCRRYPVGNLGQELRLWRSKYCRPAQGKTTSQRGKQPWGHLRSGGTLRSGPCFVAAFSGMPRQGEAVQKEP